MTAPLVVVVGPPSAGVTGVVAALTAALPECRVAEGGGPGCDDPAAAVVVTSAVAPMTWSDRDHLDAAAGADVVVAAVAKIDAHRRWRDVLEANRAWCAAVPWVGVAAAPDVGAPDVTDLVVALRTGLSSPTRLSANPFRELDALRTHRAALVGEHRSARAARAATLRAELQRERVALGALIRGRCVDLRGEFRVAAVELPRGGSDAFVADVRRAADAVLADLHARLDVRLGEVAATLGVGRPVLPSGNAADVAAPSRTSHRLENRMTVALGAGFGLGVATGLARLLAGFAPGLTVLAAVVGGVAGVGLAAWLVTARALLSDRAMLARWATETVATVRWQAAEMLGGALTTAEADLAASLAAAETARSQELGRRLRVLDGQLRTLERRGF